MQSCKWDQTAATSTGRPTPGPETWKDDVSSKGEFDLSSEGGG